MKQTLMANMIDNVFDALADHERRRLLLSLLEHNPQAAGPFDPPDDIPGVRHANEDKYLVRMHHIHLPMLEQAGFIEWRREAGEIVKGPAFEDIKPVLHFLTEHSDWAGE